MSFINFPPEVWVDILKHVSNEDLESLQNVWPFLSYLEEPREIQAVRKLVPFIRKHLPREKTWHQLNCALMKLFRDIDKGGLTEIVVTCGIRMETETEKGAKLLYTIQKLGRKLPFESVEFKSMGSEAWYRRVPVSEWYEDVRSLSRFVRISKEKMKSQILKRKMWIECISTKKCNNLTMQFVRILPKIQ